MLIKIRDYLQQHKVCTLADLSVKFHTSPEAMRSMLGHWLRKGQLRCDRPDCALSCSGGCVSCDPIELEVYRWLGKQSQIPLCAVG